MPATPPEDKPELLAEGGGKEGEAPRDGDGRGSAVSGRSVTRVPFTPQPEKEPSTMSCVLD